MKQILSIILLLSGVTAFSQNRISEASLETTGLAGSGDYLPFWFSQNQLGKYSTSSNVQELTEGKLSGVNVLSDKFNLVYGTDLGFLVNENGVRAKIIQAYAGISGKTLSLKAGAFADGEILGGLSSANGDLIRSLNYRPYPMIRLSTSGFVPLPFAKSWLQVKAEYDEGFLRDDRIVHHPHLHHKSLEFRVLASETFRFTAGVNHYVFWGGTQTLENGQKQKLPHSLKDYFRYILGRSGSSDFLTTDQENVAGNQLGSYKFTAEKDLQNYRLQARITHPFEDHSGMNLMNWRDNLYTFFIQKKKKGTPLDEFLFEYMHTKHQSREYDDDGVLYSYDNYFNHSVYSTGFSYKGYSMGTPLLFPLVKNAGGKVAGFENNRVSAFHAGARGHVSKQVCWKALLTYSRNFGTYYAPYDSVHRQFYSLAEIGWNSKNSPLSFSTQLAADFGDQADNQVGVGFSVKWTIR